MLDIKALPLLRKNMKAFIDSDPVKIYLTRTPLVETSSGGYVKGTPTTVSPQNFRLVTFKRRLSEQTVVTSAGQIPSLDYVLEGYWNADVLREDEFDLNGDHYRIKSVEPKAGDRSRTDRVVCQLELHQVDRTPPT